MRTLNPFSQKLSFETSESVIFNFEDVLFNFLHYPIFLSYISTITVWKFSLIPSTGAQNVKRLSLGTTCRHIAGVEAQSHSFLTSSLDRGECSSSLSDRFTPGRRTPVPIQQGDEWVSQPLWTILEYVNKSGTPASKGRI